MNSVFANHSKEEEIFPLTVKEIAEAQGLNKLFNSLTAMWRQDAAFFIELRARVITPRIFGRF